MHVDVAIAGAGPVGCVLALALAREGSKVALIEPPARNAAAFRPIALSHASVMLLERLGVWSRIRATPIESVHVSQAGHPGRTVFTAADAGLPALGQVTDYAVLSAALAECTGALRIEARIDACTETAHALEIALSSGARVRAACLAHAEGTSAGMHEKRYEQDALVAEVEVTPASSGRAWERFTAEGPLALLPFAGRYAAVWGASPERIAALCGAAEADFLRELQQAFGGRAGRFVRVHARSRTPLALRRRANRIEGRQVFVGNAAQALHPVAGQGLNLGLRDAWDLARTISEHAAEHGGEQADAGDARMLARFAALRKADVELTAGVTDLLATLFTGANPLSGAARGAAMLALDCCGPARRFFARRMVFGPSAMP